MSKLRAIEFELISIEGGCHGDESIDEMLIEAYFSKISEPSAVENRRNEILVNVTGPGRSASCERLTKHSSNDTSPLLCKTGTPTDGRVAWARTFVDSSSVCTVDEGN